MILNYILIGINVIVALGAVLGSLFLLQAVRTLGGEFKKAIFLITLGYSIIVIEHLLIAYLRRSHVPLSAPLWFVPFPLYVLAVLLMISGAFKMKKLFMRIAKEKKTLLISGFSRFFFLKREK